MQPAQPAVVDRKGEAASRQRGVDSAILTQLQSSGLDSSHAKLLGLHLAEPSELEAMGRKPVKTMVLPYFDLDGRQTDFRRYRYLEDPRSTWERLVTMTKGPRYFQPSGTGVYAYFPPLVSWREIAANAKQPVLITEGEKKAASATALGYPCIGLGGVDSFANKKYELPLLPELMEFKWDGRDVVIVYDSDAAENPNVLAASVRLGRRLFAQGAKVRIASLPPMADGKKQGVDDLIASVKADGGSPRAALQAVIDKANSELFEREMALYDFNRQFVYIRDLDRVMVRDDKVMLQPDAFVRRAYANLTHREWEVKETKDGLVRVAKTMPTAAVWMTWDGRLTKNTLDFDPLKGELTEHGYNLWTGWPIEPMSGDAYFWKELLSRVLPVPDERKWFEQWLAYPLQNPGAKLKTACLLWSRAEGTGKSTILESMRAIYGGLYVPMNDSAVELAYTDWLVNKLLVGVDDIASKNRDDHAAKWKNLITSPRLTIQKKYTPSFEVQSRVNFLMTSNEPNALRLSPQDRRYAVFNVPDWGTKRDRENFFDRYYKWLDCNPGVLLGHLLSVDLAGFNPDGYAIETMAKREMQELSIGPLEHWIMQLRDAPDAMIKIRGAKQPGDLWTSDDIAALYNAQPDTKSPISRNTMGMALTAAGVPLAYKGGQLRLSDKTRVRLFILRNHEMWLAADGPALRDHYEKTRRS